MAKKKKKSVLSKVLWRTVGTVLVLASVFTLLSVLSFNANDASLNLAKDEAVFNHMGPLGAYVASFFIEAFGIAFLPFLIAPVVWGYGFIRLREFEQPNSRIFAFVFGVIVFSICLSVIPIEATSFRFGGLIGLFLAKKLMLVVHGIYKYMYAEVLVVSVLAIFSLLAFNFAVGITYKDWWRAICRFCLILKKAFLLVGGICKAAFTHRGERSEIVRKPKEKAPKVRKEPKMKPEKYLEAPKKAEVQPTKKASKSRVDNYKYPEVGLISKPAKVSGSVNEKELNMIALDLEAVLQEFGVQGKIVKVRPGPVVTLYELEPSAGTKTARVIGLADDIARSMSVSSVRIAVVMGSNTIGIEMPNVKRETVWLRELFEDNKFNDTKNTLNIVLGKDIGGQNVYADLAKMPHLLVAGTTGSGKSVGVNQMILSLLYRMSPDECKLIMIDPKMLEFSMYNGIPHLLTPVITDPSKAVVGLKWAVKEMEDRYKAMAQLNVRNISGYNQKLGELKNKGEVIKRTVQTGFDAETGKPIFEEQELDLTPLPYIVIVVDEIADLMLVAGKDVEAAIQRLAQMARAAGIHLIMSTQRPSVDVITGTIKANFPTRISFQVTSKIDSRTILGEQGAEQLLGRGDMLYMPAGQRPVRIHGSFVKDEEIEKVVDFLKAQKAPEYIDDVTAGELGDNGGAVFDKGSMGSGEDELYKQAVAIVRQDGKASTSYLQRKMRIGYNKAASIIDQMEADGVVSRADHIGRREVL